MKKIKPNSFLLLGLLMQVFLMAGAQNPIVIDSSNSGIFIQPLHDSVINSLATSSCSTYHYEIDIDNNDSLDFKFTTVCYLGGMGASYVIKLLSADDAFFALDTNVIDTVGVFDSTGTAVYSPAYVHMVKIFNYLDTINPAVCNQQSEKFIVNRNLSYYPSLCEHSSLDYWVSGPHYIGIKKKINGIDYTGWIKVEVVDYNRIKFIEIALNANLASLETNNIQTLQLYPNPVNTALFLQTKESRESNYLIQNIQGQVILKGILKGDKNSIDMSSLSGGIYIIQLEQSGNFYRQKLVKN